MSQTRINNIKDAVLVTYAYLVSHDEKPTIHNIVKGVYYNLSKSTVRRRINDLINEGMIYDKHITQKGFDYIKNLKTQSIYDIINPIYIDYVALRKDLVQPLSEPVPLSEYTYSYVKISGTCINIFQYDKFGNVIPKVFMETSKQYKEACDVINDPNVVKSDTGLIQDTRMDELFLEKVLPDLVSIKTNNRVIIDPKANTVTVDGLTLNGTIIDIIMSIYTRQDTAEKRSLDCLLNFLDKLVDNPSRKVFDNLYDFIKYNDIEIDEDGFIIAWKRVRSDYMDIYSNSISNKPGETIKMSRLAVNDNPDQTCSHGLHVCAKGYLTHFRYDSDDRVVKVKINPKDFVSVPTDYGGKKARVCEYYVIEDVTDQITL